MSAPPWYHSMSPSGGLSLRATATGIGLGTLLCFSNSWFGLQTGWVTMASLQSAVLAHGIWALLARWRPQLVPLSIAEHVMLTTISTASATMPLAAGFVGIIPALRILAERGEAGDAPPPLQTAGAQLAWCLSVAFLGVFVAVPLRGYLTALRFPSGTATAIAIAGLHAHRSGAGAGAEVGEHVTSGTGARVATAAGDVASENPLQVLQPPPPPPPPPLVVVLDVRAPDGTVTAPVPDDAASSPAPPPVSLRLAWLAFLASAALSLCSFFLPVLGGVPLASYVGLPGVSAWSWVATLSLSYAGQGMIMGLHTCASMAAGAVLAWGVIGPAAQSAGWVVKPLASGPTGGRGFLLWISLAILLAEAAVGAALALWGMARGSSAAAAAGAGGGGRAPIPPSPESSSGGSVGGLSGDDELAKQLPGSSGDRGGYDERPLDAATGGGAATAAVPTPAPAPAPASTTTPAPPAAAAAAASPPPVLAAAAPPPPVLPTWVWASGLAATSAVAVLALMPLASVSLGEALLAVLFSLPISVVAVRCLGETDLNPVSGLGKVTQVAFGALYPANLVGNVIAGAVAEAGAQQAGDLMQDMKTGLLLGVPLPAQFAGQCLGSLVSVFAATAAFHVFDGAYGVPSASLPAPTAAIWVSMAELMSGAGALPPNALPFMAVGAVAAAAVAATISLAEGGGGGSGEREDVGALRRLARRAAPYLPSPTAFSIGIYITANWTLPRLAGAVAAAVLARRGMPQQSIIMLATGLVLGEGCMALVTATLASLGARPASCGGCAPGLCGNFCS